ncbi:hypothetical protein V1291_000377 [Nitrobacteraceae bacterium AZCC 1564]
MSVVYLPLGILIGQFAPGVGLAPSMHWPAPVLAIDADARIEALYRSSTSSQGPAPCLVDKLVGDFVLSIEASTQFHPEFMGLKWEPQLAPRNGGQRPAQALSSA